MKKETTFLKLFTLLVLSCLSVGYAWADDDTTGNSIAFDRKDFPSSWEDINCDSRSVPSGSGWSVEGNLFKNTSWGQEHYYGYNTPGENFIFKFTNFKYEITSIVLSIDAGDRDTAKGLLDIMPYTGKTESDSAKINVEVADQYSWWKTYDDDINSQTKTYTTSIKGMTELKYIHQNKINIFFDHSNFLQIFYKYPVISAGAESTLPSKFGPGCTYTLKDADVSWDNYQGAFTIDDVLFTNSSNTGAITISNDGKSITGVAAGTATITVQVVNTPTATDKNAIASSYFTFEVKVADPTITKADNKVTASGCWTSKNLQESLSSNVDANTTSVDLTGSTIYGAAVAVPTTNPNVLIKANAGQVSNDHNVIVDGVCNKLELADGNRFSTEEDFATDATVYTRSTTSTWGTICLPYAPVTTDDIAYYTLQSASSNSLTFVKVNTPVANTPYLFKNTGSSGYNASYTAESTTNRIQVSATDGAFESTAINGYKLCGVFNPTSIVDGINTVYTDALDGYDKITDEYAYYFKNNQFNLINGRMNMAGFRAYLTQETSTSGGAKASMLNVSFDNNDEVSTGLKFIENKDDGTVKVIFDTNGRKLNAPQKGINVINGQKVLVK